MNKYVLVIFFIVIIFVNLFYFLFYSKSNLGNAYTVKVDESGFSPRNLEIKLGEKVIFENVGKNEHWPASNMHPTHSVYSEFDPKKGIKPGERWEFVFERSGTWRMHDHLNPESSGVIKVIGNDLGGKKMTFFEKFLKWIPFVENKPEGALYDEDIKSDDLTISDDKDALYSYVKKFGPKQAVVQLASVDQSTGANCHDDAHLLGKYAYEVYGNETFGMCSAECHSGCYHGATEAFFKENGTDNLQENLSIVCGTAKNSFFSHQCLHGVGHGLMAWSDYEIHDALKECDMLEQGTESCYSGVFMENIVGALASDDRQNSINLDKHVTKYLSDDPHFPCTIVNEKYKSACYFYQSSRMLQVLSYDFEKVAKECESINTEYRYLCFESMGRDVGGFSNNVVEQAVKICNVVENNAFRIDCFEGAVQNAFWDPSGQDTAIKFCKALPEISEKDACYVTIIERAGQVLVSLPDKKKFCDKLEYNYIAQCEQKIYLQ